MPTSMKQFLLLALLVVLPACGCRTTQPTSLEIRKISYVSDAGYIIGMRGDEEMVLVMWMTNDRYQTVTCYTSKKKCLIHANPVRWVDEEGYKEFLDKYLVPLELYLLQKRAQEKKTYSLDRIATF